MITTLKQLLTGIPIVALVGLVGLIMTGHFFFLGLIIWAAVNLIWVGGGVLAARKLRLSGPNRVLKGQLVAYLAFLGIVSMWVLAMVMVFG